MSRRGTWITGAMGLTAAMLVVAAPTVAAADQCAPSYVRASVSTPLADQAVASTVRFRVDERTGCGEALPSVAPEYRIVGPDGPLPFEQLDDSVGDHQLVPARPLPIGPTTLEARDPVSETEWGDWHPIRTVQVEDRIDDRAPRFEGITDASAEVVIGHIYISPCEGAEGPVVETTLTFPLADDGPTPHDELLYTLERSNDGGATWSRFRIFRPDVPEPGLGRYDWEDEHGWDQTWSYRISVVDASGHRTLGSSVATVKAPARPLEVEHDPFSDVDGIHESAEVRSDDGDDSPLAPKWQWSAELGTLVGALLAAFKPRRRR